ncbi:MAG: translation elongation factor 4, partial [Bacteroidota bacterium]
IPIANKIDMPNAQVDETIDQIVELIGCKKEDIILASGKTGEGIENVLTGIVERIPAPTGDPEAPLQALVFDSVFNQFRGVIAYFKIVNGTLRKGDKVRFFYAEKEYNTDEVGILQMDMIPKPEMRAGDVGYIITGIKVSKEIKVGDTITHVARPCHEAIRGFEDVKPMVFAGIFPIENEDFEDLRESLEKLQLNDSALVFEPETSAALGFGFRCGFLGMLHLEIVQERLSREFDMEVITTIPNVSYVAHTTSGEEFTLRTPSDFPDPTHLDFVEEPYIQAQIITKPDYIGAIMTLCLDKRGIFIRQIFLTPNRVEMIFEMPLGEIVFDFYDRLKSISRGYASFDYHPIGVRQSDLVKVDIRLNSESVDALSALVHKDKAQ